MERPSLDEIFAGPKRPSLDEIFTQTEQPTGLDGAASPQIGIGHTAFDQGMQGATFGFSDEISDGLGAFGAKVYSTAFDPELTAGKSVGDLYDEARSLSKQRLNAEFEQNPGTSIASSILGSVATGAPKAIVSTLRSGGLAARAIKGGITGAASGGLYGAGTADDGDRLQGAESGAELGGSLGPIIPISGAAAGAALKAATPTIQEGLLPVVQLAQKYKIPVALSQVSEGNALKNFQKVSKEIPFSGEAQFRDEQMKSFNRALIKTVGGNSNKFTPELMDNLFTKVGTEFDNLGKGKTFDISKDFLDSAANITSDAEQIATKDTVSNINKAVQSVLDGSDNGKISGEKLGAIRAETNRLARKATNPDTKELLRDLENSIVDVMTSGDDATKGAFSATKQKYKNLLVLEPLASKAKGGNLSPALLQNRVSKIYGRQFTRGKAGEIGDLARIGNEILPEVGGSDTVQKGIYAGGAGTLGVMALNNPALAIATGGKAAIGLGLNRAAQAGINRNQSLLNAAVKKSSPLKITIRPDVNLPRVNP